MQIEKNIAATLSAIKQARNETLSAFSKDLDIPLSTLQGYLKGTSSPRADTLEELAKKLGMTPAELVSGRSSPRGRSLSCLDLAPLEIAALHPDVQPLAEEAVAILRSAFRISDQLNAIAPPPDAPVGSRQYLPFELCDPRLGTPDYGILVKERLPEGWAQVAVVAPFSSDRCAVARLAALCTELQLSPVHLLDMVQDFLIQEEVLR